MNTKRLTLIASVAVLLIIVALGARAMRVSQPADDQDAMCPITTTDCDDTPVTDGSSQDGETTTTIDGQRLDAERLDALEQEARGLLGRNESDLPSDVRIGRRGDEAMMLTDDFVIGRMTVELDDTDGSGFRVVSVTVEIPNGSQTYELQPG